MNTLLERAGPTAVEPSEAEFRRLQQTDGSVRGYEWEDGTLVPMAPLYDPRASAWLAILLPVQTYLQANPVGRAWPDFATYLDGGRRRRYFPDLVFLSNEDMGRYDGEKVVGPPTRVCEVATPNSLARDRGEKKEAYHAAGVCCYWLLDLVNSRMEEYRWAEAGYERVSSTPAGEVFRPALFPGLEIPLKW